MVGYQESEGVVTVEAPVVYESMYGNTRDVAEAIGAGLSSCVAVNVVEVSSAPADIGDDVELVVVGGPTHAFGMSRSSTCADAAAAAPVTLLNGRGWRCPSFEERPRRFPCVRSFRI